jgi:hypothetical protein
MPKIRSKNVGEFDGMVDAFDEESVSDCDVAAALGSGLT